MEGDQSVQRTPRKRGPLQCQYPSTCNKERAIKPNGERHWLCDSHRKHQNSMQRARYNRNVTAMKQKMDTLGKRSKQPTVQTRPATPCLSRSSGRGVNRPKKKLQIVPHAGSPSQNTFTTSAAITVPRDGMLECAIPSSITGSTEAPNTSPASVTCLPAQEPLQASASPEATTFCILLQAIPISSGSQLQLSLLTPTIFCTATQQTSPPDITEGSKTTNK